FRGGPGEIDVAADVLRVQYVVCAAVGFARNHRHARDRGFAEHAEQFRAVAEDAAGFLYGTGQESRGVCAGDEPEAAAVAREDEAGPFDRRVDVQAAGEMHRLVGYDADGFAPEMHETDGQVRRV